MIEAAAADGAAAPARNENGCREKHPQRRRGEVDPDRREVVPKSAEASVRAGFMLIPDNGASKVMNRATSVPAATPVKRAIGAGAFDTVSTTLMSTNAMSASERNAAGTPPGIGFVTIAFAGGPSRSEPASAAMSANPSAPPANCASTYAAASIRCIFPNHAKVSVTLGLRCAPERAPHRRIDDRHRGEAHCDPEERPAGRVVLREPARQRRRRELQRNGHRARDEHERSEPPSLDGVVTPVQGCARAYHGWFRGQ